MRQAWFLIAVLAATSACGKGDRKQCEQACRNYATLSFWAKWDPKIDAEPEAQRAKLKKDKLVELEFILERGIDQCVSTCQTANNEEQYTCMVKAKTYGDIRACGENEAEANQ